MADLPFYQTLKDKSDFFANGNGDSFVINSKQQLDKWFSDVVDEEKTNIVNGATALIYRGVNDAKYKILSSSQRMWLSNEMSQWANRSYLQFISDLVEKASSNTLIEKVFDLYNYNRREREFPILSLLQHYGAPTPLIDWTYNRNVAFYFGIDGLKKKEVPKTEIDNYFSIYRINKRKYQRELLNILDISETSYPSILDFVDFGESNDNINGNSIFYLSDFENRGESTGDSTPARKLMIRTRRPITSVYNHNIIPQEGLLMFNPFYSKSIEEIFKPNFQSDGYNLHLTPFDCFNIHKDLSDYLRRKVEVRFKINKSFIYPELKDEARKIKEQTLNGLV
jgi:hypothetical protein